jgi:hypothetical protein
LISTTATPKADPGKQTKSLAWRQLPLNQLIQTMHDYTKDAVAQLKAADGEPDMVQVAPGNVGLCSDPILPDPNLTPGAVFTNVTVEQITTKD